MLKTGFNSNYTFDLKITPGKGNQDCEGTLYISIPAYEADPSGYLGFEGPFHFYAHSSDEIEIWAKRMIDKYPGRNLIWPEYSS